MNLNEVIKLSLTSLTSIAATLAIVVATQPSGLPTGIVTIDATEAVLAFIKAGGKDMADADYERVAKTYQEDLEAAISTFAKEHSVIVVNSAAVLAGAPDITMRVAQEALTQLNEKEGVTK